VRPVNGLREKHKCWLKHIKGLVVAIGINWRKILKAKSKRQQDLSTWTDEDWGSAEQHRAKDKGKKPKSRTKGRYMPRATYKRTDKKTLRYQDAKKRKGRKKGKQHVPTGRKFSQK
tara:strand:+ start:36 stop:383 length:348 start_codon:yes stop_codon:yes gene_type:complete